MSLKVIVIIVAVIAYLALNQGSFDVTVEVTINAPIEKVFDVTNDMTLYQQYHPAVYDL
jgi:hypothetical protein